MDFECSSRWCWVTGSKPIRCIPFHSVCASEGFGRTQPEIHESPAGFAPVEIAGVLQRSAGSERKFRPAALTDSVNHRYHSVARRAEPLEFCQQRRFNFPAQRDGGCGQGGLRARRPGSPQIAFNLVQPQKFVYCWMHEEILFRTGSTYVCAHFDSAKSLLSNDNAEERAV
jgi:hypothetical protein